MDEINVRGDRYKDFSFLHLTARALLILLLIGVAFAFYYWQDEGYLGHNFLLNFLADIYPLFLFPAVTLAYKFGFYTWTFYIAGLAINAYLYALLIELISFILFKIKANKALENVD